MVIKAIYIIIVITEQGTIVIDDTLGSIDIRRTMIANDIKY